MPSSITPNSPFDNEKRFAKSTSGKKSEASQRAAELENSRPKPIPLQSEIPPAQPYPFDALGSILGAAARRVSEVVKAPDAICGQSFLAAAALLTQPHASVLIHGRIYPTTLFLLSIAASGERKTAADGFALLPIKEFQQAEWRNYSNDLKRVVIEKERWNAQKKRAIASEKDEDIESLPDEPESPLVPTMICSDPTVEGIHRGLQEGRGMLGVFADEAAALIGGHSMRDENRLRSCAVLSTLWQGEAMTSLRQGEGNRPALYGKRVAVHLLGQPCVFQEMKRVRTFDDQGLLARFLVAFPPSMAGQQSYSSVDLAVDPDFVRYVSRCSELLKRPLPLVQGTRNDLNPFPMTLSQDAENKWIELYDEINVARGCGGRFEPILSFSAKAAEHCLRIAGVLKTFDDPEACEIGLSAIERAIILTKWYLDEALRIEEVGSVSEEMATAQKLLMWMRARIGANSEKIISMREFISGQRIVMPRNKKNVTKILDLLASYGWVRKLDWCDDWIFLG